jgi:hypothetical protein
MDFGFCSLHLVYFVQYSVYSIAVARPMNCLLIQLVPLYIVSPFSFVVCLKRFDVLQTRGICIQIISKSLQKQILLDISAILNSPASKSRDQVRMYYL